MKTRVSILYDGVGWWINYLLDGSLHVLGPFKTENSARRSVWQRGWERV